MSIMTNNDHDVLPTTNAEQDIDILNDTIYFSVDEHKYGDYDTDTVAQDMTYDQYYTPSQYASATDNGLNSSDYVNLQSTSGEARQEFESHASNLELLGHRGIGGQESQEAIEIYPDTGYETEVGIPVDHSKFNITY